MSAEFVDLAVVQTSDLEKIGGVPLLLLVDQGDEKVTDWAANNYQHINRLLFSNGALLIRGLSISGSKQLSRTFSNLFGEELIPYMYASTPRTALRSNVYTATEYHSDELIVQHNEQSYANEWPMQIGFFCQTVAERGGETPIADSKKVLARIPAHIRDEFESKQLMYLRNYQDIDLPWNEVFKTDDKTEVEAYCEGHNIQYEWLPNNVLKTRQINKALAVHPRTGDKIWFNQAHLFHGSALKQEVRESLLSIMSEDMLPRNVYFGDGSKIPDEYIEAINQVYRDLEIRFPWQQNDVMLLDNMLYSHGRTPFSGDRKILTGMAGICKADL